MEQQVTESSMDEGNITAGFSTQASVDSTSFLISEIADIPDHTCSSEDLRSLEVQGSLRSGDFSPYNTIRTANTDASCTSLEHGIRCGFHRNNSQWSPGDDDGLSSIVSVDRTQAQDYDSSTQARAPDCLSGRCSALEKEPQSSVRDSTDSPSLKPTKTRCSAFSQSTSHFQPSPSSIPANTPSHSGCCESSLRHKHVRKYRLANIVRSTSDPVSCSSSRAGGTCTCASTCSEHPDACQAALQTAQFPSPHTTTASACQETVCNFFSTGRQKDTRKSNLQLKPKVLQNVSKDRPHSLVDLKAYKDTKILVAKFLEHSNCSLPPEVRHVVNSIKSVIKSDERHMEEAIFSANILDQVFTTSQQNANTSRKRLQEDLHLQSCGALSSPVVFPRRTSLTQSLERDRPHSLVSVCRETIL